MNWASMYLVFQNIGQVLPDVAGDVLFPQNDFIHSAIQLMLSESISTSS